MKENERQRTTVPKRRSKLIKRERRPSETYFEAMLEDNTFNGCFRMGYGDFRVFVRLLRVKLVRDAKMGSLRHGAVLVEFQCVCDARYRIIAWTMNSPGSQNGRTAYKFWAVDKLLNRLSPGYFIVGDAAYPASDRVLAPYPGKNLPASKDAYNFLQSQCRMSVEQTFGILVRT